MSRDVVMYRFNDYPLKPDADLERLERLPLGKVAEVRDLVSSQLPDTEWESYYTGYFIGDGFRLDFYVGGHDSEEEDRVFHLDITLHGNPSEAAIDTLLQLAHPNRWTTQEMVDGMLILPRP